MKYISIGDVVGDLGIDILEEQLPSLIKEYNPDFVIVNIENIADGLGVDLESFNRVNKIEGIDCFVLGNHTWDKSEVIKVISDPRVVRPYNYGGSPGRGVRHFKKNDKDIFVIQLMGEVNIYKKTDNPFKSLDEALEEVEEIIEKHNEFKDKSMAEYIDKDNIYILIDFHSEATSETIAMGYYADGKVSSILSSHTHIQTSDERILPKGSAYITDIGMTGPYESVLGMDINVAFERFIKDKRTKYEVALSDTKVLSAVFVDIDDETKKAIEIKRIREVY